MSEQDLNNDFAWTVYNRYRKYCEGQNETETMQGLVKYMVSCGVVKQSTLRRLMVCDIYPQALNISGGRKGDALGVISEQTGLAEKTVKSILTRPNLYKPKM